MQLVAYGAQDIYLTGNPQITFFKVVYRRHTNFAMESIEQTFNGAVDFGRRVTATISRNGDLIKDMWLEVFLSDNGTASQKYGAGNALVKQVEVEIGGQLIDRQYGEWMDVWSRVWLDAGRSAVWDADIYGQLPVEELHSTARPGWTTVQPTEDGYVYCWLPLTFLRRPQTAFPLVAVGDTQEIRLHITLRPFADVVRRRAVPRTSPTEVPLGEVIGVQDITGLTPVPYEIRLPTGIPSFEDATVFAGVAHLEDPLRSAYMRQSLEMIYEPVTHMMFDIPDKVVAVSAAAAENTVKMQLRLSELNGPIREICWFIRRKAVWGYNEWTNYGALLEDGLIASIPLGVSAALRVPRQQPMLRSARLMVGNAVWRDESEQWWRTEYGLENRGGVRVAGGMVYGVVLGDAREWRSSDLQPAGTINASRADLRLDLDIAVPTEAPAGCGDDASGRTWEVHVFGIGLNWMRFVGGLAGPLFKD